MAKFYLLGLLSSLVTSAAFATANIANGTTVEFKVPPYIYTQGGSQIKIGWSYAVAPSETVAAVFNDGMSSRNLAIHSDKEIYYAELPTGICGAESNFSYQVTGMAQAVPIQPLVCPGDSAPMKFVFLADTQIDSSDGPSLLTNFTNQLIDFGAQAVILGGDLTEHGASQDAWTQFFNVMNPAFSTRLLIPGMGNHEYHGDSTVKNWQHYFQKEATNAFYTFDIGEMQIISLNSAFEDDPSLRERQRDWLEAQLLLTHPRWRIVFFHHPPYSTGWANNPTYPKKEYKYVQELYVPLFEKYHVDMVLNGHVHIYERSERNGIPYIITGAAAGTMGILGNWTNIYSKFYQRIRTVIEFSVDHNVLIADAVDLQGLLVDSVVLQKP